LDLFLFTTDVQYAREALRAGIDGLVVDWEHVGKEERQSSADTEINHDTPDDLRRLRRAVDAPILVRINAACDETAAEVEEAIAGGATEILLPMVRRVHEVEELLRIGRQAFVSFPNFAHWRGRASRNCALARLTS